MDYILQTLMCGSICQNHAGPSSVFHVVSTDFQRPVTEFVHQLVAWIVII